MELSAHGFNLVLDPVMGGSILHFTRTDNRVVPLLRPSPESPSSILDVACFPLVPFSNRIRDGHFSFDGHDVRLSPNMPGERHAIHGQGWLSPWSVEARGADHAALTYHHPAGEWPWAYEAHQHFRLTAQGLDVRITCRNLSDGPMPCGLGFHPYFPCDGATRIVANVRKVWTVDAEIMPVERMAVDGHYALDGPACARGLDNGYGGWDGIARISPSGVPFDLLLEGPGCRFFQLYSPPSGGVFVAEPVSHANDILSRPQAEWAEGGVRILQPGEAAELTMRLRITQRL